MRTGTGSRRNVLLVVGALILSLVVVAAGALLWFVLRAPEPDAVLDLERAKARATVEARRGASLSFFLSAKLEPARGGSSRDRHRKLSDALRTVELELLIAPPEGKERLHRCKPSAGGTLVTSGGEVRAVSLPTDCTFDVEASGEHAIRARVDWGEVSASEATLGIVVGAGGR